MIRSVTSRSSRRVDRAAPVAGQVDRLTAPHGDRLAGQRPEPVPVVAVEHLAGAPVHHRHDRDVGGQREPGDAGAALHGPAVGVAGDRALRVDDHDLARLQRVGCPRAGSAGRRPCCGRPGSVRCRATPEPSSGTRHRLCLARNRGTRPALCTTSPLKIGSRCETWLATSEHAALGRDVFQPLEPRPPDEPAGRVEEDRTERDPEAPLLPPHTRSSARRSVESLPGGAAAVHLDVPGRRPFPPSR